MENQNKMIKTAIVAVLALTTVNTISAGTSAKEQNMEKCYGIVKAGMNDCQTATASCAGSAKKDKQSDAFIFVPKGSCNKIVGGVLK